MFIAFTRGDCNDVLKYKIILLVGNPREKVVFRITVPRMSRYAKFDITMTLSPKS